MIVSAGRKYNRVENLAAAMCMILGLFIANPFTQIFEMYPVLYKPMKEIWNQELFWGGWLAICGASALVLINYFHKRSLGALVAGSGIMALATLWGTADLFSPGWAVCLASRA